VGERLSVGFDEALGSENSTLEGSIVTDASNFAAGTVQRISANQHRAGSKPVFRTIQASKRGKVGPLTAEERQRKVARYLAKRKQRTWGKRIAYACRKRVADNRVRVKGRFVSKTQAGLVAPN
jgi:hypothetical protein